MHEILFLKSFLHFRTNDHGVKIFQDIGKIRFHLLKLIQSRSCSISNSIRMNLTKLSGKINNFNLRNKS